MVEDAPPRGGALLALALVLAITVAWWALALWPVGLVEPEWLARTRAACFGSVRGGLPDAGGWILLVGEPLGMAAMIALVFRRSLHRDLQWIVAHRAWRFLLVSLGSMAMLVIALLAGRAAGLWTAVSRRTSAGESRPQRVDRQAPDIGLIDQNGRRVSLARQMPERVLLTFAFGHCSTVCPAIVSTLQRARRDARRQDVPILILTVDPWRDTPDRLPTLAEHWSVRGGDRVLSGDIDDVNRVLDALGVGRNRNTTTGDIEHLGTVMVVAQRGQVVWRADGGPREVAALLRKL